MLGEVVHTTGVNWQSIAVNASIIIGGVAIVGRVIVTSVRRSVGDQVADVIASQVTPRLDFIGETLTDHAKRIARLEGVEEGKKQAIAAAGVTTT